ncbi:MAG TPA: tripartite tricarboxylate transporter TctB family protein [Methylomirabilota bacterium]|nr:tripartite tricarboxylate transporter TctB family protein [Methylomirabilota bacterium]
MRAADLTTAVVLIAGGLLVIWDSLRIGIGWGTDGPKSGFFPFWLGVLMIGACIAIAAQAIRRADRTPFVRREAIAPVLKVLLPATAFVLSTHWIGLYVATTLYMASYMRWIGRHSWLSVVVVSVTVSFVTFFVFELWFLVPMPKGPLETSLGY